MSNQFGELMDKFTQIQKKYENLIVENEKLRSDQRSKRFLNKSQTLTGKNKSFVFGKLVSKERSYLMDDSKSISNIEKENSNKKNLKGKRFLN